MTHTPGPWKATIKRNCSGIEIDYDHTIITPHRPSMGVVATIAFSRTGAKRGQAVRYLPSDADYRNACILEAAPDLYDAALEFTGACHEAVRLLNGAGIACPAGLALAAEKARNAIAKAGTLKGI
jgi:hypothetical protein